MSSFNKVFLMGNLTRDIELRHIPTTNTAVAKIGIAVNRSWRDANTNELKEEVTFVDCEAFGKTAETMSKYLAKGRPVFIEGRLKLDTWQDKNDGSNKSKLKVIVENFRFIDSKPGGGGGAQGNVTVRSNAPAAPAGARPAPSAPEGYEPIQEEDIPF
jgi:single-strand DNA-binding protein